MISFRDRIQFSNNHVIQLIVAFNNIDRRSTPLVLFLSQIFPWPSDSYTHSPAYPAISKGTYEGVSKLACRKPNYRTTPQNLLPSPPSPSQRMAINSVVMFDLKNPEAAQTPFRSDSTPSLSATPVCSMFRTSTSSPSAWCLRPRKHSWTHRRLQLLPVCSLTPLWCSILNIEP